MGMSMCTANTYVSTDAYYGRLLSAAVPTLSFREAAEIKESAASARSAWQAGDWAEARDWFSTPDHANWASAECGRPPCDLLAGLRASPPPPGARALQAGLRATPPRASPLPLAALGEADRQADFSIIDRQWQRASASSGDHEADDQPEASMTAHHSSIFSVTIALTNAVHVQH